MQADLISRHARDRSDRDFTSSLIRETSGLSAYARKLTGSGVDADDLLQDTMLFLYGLLEVDYIPHQKA